MAHKVNVDGGNVHRTTGRLRKVRQWATYGAPLPLTAACPDEALWAAQDWLANHYGYDAYVL